MSTLAMWTVYNNPKDYPGKFVARRFDVEGSGAKPSASIIIMDSLPALRNVLAGIRNAPQPHRSSSPEDDAKIVETWR